MPPPPRNAKNSRKGGSKTGSRSGFKGAPQSGAKTGDGRSAKPGPKRDVDDGSKLYSRGEAKRGAARTAKPQAKSGSGRDGDAGAKPFGRTDAKRGADAGAKPRARTDARRDADPAAKRSGKPDPRRSPDADARSQRNPDRRRGTDLGAKSHGQPDPRRPAAPRPKSHAKPVASAGPNAGAHAVSQGDSKAGQRIAKLLARAGIASRREIERMIGEGRIALNGVPLETPATILPNLNGITVDGAAVQAAAPTQLFRYHKPSGLLTAERDFTGRPTIYDRLPEGLPRVIPVGRLDLNTEGLLLLTTDGELKRQLELPRTGVVRSYRARAYGQVSQAQLEDLIEGVEIEGVRYGSIDANLERRTGANVWVEMRLTEGKNREVRRVLEHLGLQVSRLIRTSYGTLSLGDLPSGAVEEVPQHELVAFRKALK
ncbi:pseudouridine synthase [Sphingomonas colocasiae]|uniref:Pseudouridine synthase n=1 Tax=Sphingomonas colocasiae TaxID=1848973 RepID=A0ABS7PI26_9SPHN|nr:pseudouridine synthase [Sphingomonas colocasiae]